MDVYPTLTSRDVKTALRWIENAFGLEPRTFTIDVADDIDHAALLHRDGMVLVESEHPDELHGSHAGLGWVYIAVDDIDALPPRQAGRSGAAERAQRRHG